MRAALALEFVGGTALAFLLLHRRLRTLVSFCAVFAVILAWWIAIPASNTRDWQPDVAVTPWATSDGDRVTLHGVGNLDYQTETKFVARWARSAGADPAFSQRIREGLPVPR